MNLCKIKSFTFSFLSLAALALSDVTHSEKFGPSMEDILGKWKFSRIADRSQEPHTMDPALVLTLKLDPPNSSTLYWTRDDGKTFCEGRGVFDWNGHIFVNQITWVNPLNMKSCTNAFDLQIGKRINMPAWIFNNLLHVDLGHGTESLIYIWTKIIRD